MVGCWNCGRGMRELNTVSVVFGIVIYDVHAAKAKVRLYIQVIEHA